MKKQTIVCAVFMLAALVYSIAYSDPKDPAPAPDIAQLQDRRVELLQERVDMLKVLFEAGLVDRQDVTRPQVELLQAKLEYATTDAQRKSLLQDIVKQYDGLIALAQVATEMPVQPGRNVKHLRGLAQSDYLFLQAEQLRYQIEYDKLPAS